eukprot:15011682-Alexandrium_andersonii.AAC.1
MVPSDVAPHPNAAPAPELAGETSRVDNHPNAGPSSGVEQASVARPSRGRSMPEVFDMAMGDSEHLRYVEGGDPS